MELDSRLVFRIVWKDEDVIELDVWASNGRYSGQTRIYATSDELEEMSRNLPRFPKDVSAKYEQTFGEKGGVSCVSLKFYCFNKAGHAAVQVYMEDQVPTDYREEEKNKVELEIKCEAASIDEFSRQLNEMGKRREGTAVLPGHEG